MSRIRASRTSRVHARPTNDKASSRASCAAAETASTAGPASIATFKRGFPAAGRAPPRRLHRSGHSSGLLSRDRVHRTPRAPVCGRGGCAAAGAMPSARTASTMPAAGVAAVGPSAPERAQLRAVVLLTAYARLGRVAVVVADDQPPALGDETRSPHGAPRLDRSQYHPLDRRSRRRPGRPWLPQFPRCSCRRR